MQDEPGQEPGRAASALAGPDQDPAGRLALPRPERQDRDLPGPRRNRGQELGQTVGAVDEDDVAPLSEPGEAGRDPAREIGRFDPRRGAAGLGRGARPAGLEEGRVAHHPVEGLAAQVGRGCHEIALDQPDPRGEARQLHARPSEPQRFGVALDADDRELGEPSGEAEGGGAGAAAGIEHPLARGGADRGGEQHGVDRRPIAAARLEQPDPAAEQGVERRRRRMERDGSRRGWCGGRGFPHAVTGRVCASRARRVIRPPKQDGPAVPPGRGRRLLAAPAARRDEPERSALEAAQALVRDDLDRVNRLILERLQSQVPLIPELARHLIVAGGKRIRPMLTLLTARLCGYTGEHHVALATAVEFIHTATLLHDDVVDDSDLRRGKATANAVWGNKAPVLVGDFLFSRAFQLMVGVGNLEVLGILARASAVIAEGEVLQLVTANDTATSEEAYLEMIAGKTAALFEAACEVGAVVAGRPAAEVRALATYGRALGIAFQLVDDALDYAAREAELGKAVGDDFRDGKITLPVLVAFAKGDEAERAFWRRTLERVEQDERDLAEAQRLLARHRAIEATLERAQAYGRAAREALAPFPRGKVKEALLGLVDFCIHRAY